MDGNIDIIGPEFYESIIAAVEGGTVYGMLKHPFSDDSYDEALRCLAGERIDLGTALRAVSNLKKHGVARNEGLMESNVLLRKHNEPEVIAMGNCWWSKMTRIAMRDQLTLQCALHETGLKPDLLWNGRSTRDFPAVRYRGHNRCWVKDRSLRGRLRYLRLEIGKLILRLRIWWM